jgi:tyrosyl-tRNA synthetase
MSKSLNNYVGMGEDALSMYSKLEKTPDNLIQDYFTLLTDLPLDSLPDNPRAAQKLLSLEVVTQYHGRERALQAQADAIALITKPGQNASGDSVPEFSIGSVNFPAKLFHILAASGLCSGSNDAKRQIQGGAVRLDGVAISDVDLTYEDAAALVGKVLQVGKKRFKKLVD